jgi:hypothetical protein
MVFSIIVTGRGNEVKPLLMKDYNESSLTRRIDDMVNRNQNWYLIKRGETFEHSYKIFWAVLKQGDETFAKTEG